MSKVLFHSTVIVLLVCLFIVRFVFNKEGDWFYLAVIGLLVLRPIGNFYLDKKRRSN
ncbi:hypothetical protein [Shouchella lehensis]|uniref:Uncharacterized protein n=1 Tax=Shouchella lehensis G1 TaxID=1246626 RepID=A0A060LS66_9BACI|nr:hypothetical protein [Shouchella lehensis]AIC92885.1 hypothetical protein BleG1_0277 [Shouchella lehensis G1]